MTEYSSRVIWDEGSRPGPELVALGIACTLSFIAVDLMVSDGVSWIFDVPFVVLCVALALAVRPGDFFHIGILPPLLLVGSFLLLGATRPATIAHERDGVVQAVVSGLAHHSLALVLGYVGSLAVLAIRDRRLRALSRGSTF